MFDEDEIFENIFSEINVCPKLGDAMFDEDDVFRIYLLQLMFVPILGMLRLMNMIFLASQVLICKVVVIKSCLLLIIILMKVGLEECQL